MQRSKAARHLSIARSDPRTTVAWEGDRVSGTVELAIPGPPLPSPDPSPPTPAPSPGPLPPAPDPVPPTPAPGPPAPQIRART